MEKNLSINLGGTLFNIDENAYQRLSSYLEEVRLYFESVGENSQEIIQDIEMSLADHLREKLNGEIRPLSISEIEEALDKMGRVKDFAFENNNSEKKEIESEKGARKFYRDGENAIIAGVCSGLANYFGFDAVWVRLAFVGSLFFGGLGFWVYLIFWIASSEAKTPAQKLEMSGQPITLSSLSEQVKQKKILPAVSRAGEGFVSALEKFFRLIFSTFLKIIKIVWRIFCFFCALFLVLGSLFFIGLLSFFAAIAVFQNHSPFFDQTFIDMIGGQYYLLAILGFFCLLLPAVGALLLGVSIFKKKSLVPISVWLSIFGLWFVASVFCAVEAFSVYPDVRAYTAAEVVQEMPVGEVSNIIASGNFDLEIVNGTTASLQIIGHPSNLENIEVKNENKILFLEEKNISNQSCLMCVNRPIKLILSTPGLEKITAKKNVDLFLSDYSDDQLFLELADRSEFSAGEAKINFLNLQVIDNSEFEGLSAQIKEAKVVLGGSAFASLPATEKTELLWSPSADSQAMFVYLSGKGELIVPDDNFKDKRIIKALNNFEDGRSHFYLNEDDEKNSFYSTTSKTIVFSEEELSNKQIIKTESGKNGVQYYFVDGGEEISVRSAGDGKFYFSAQEGE